VKCKLEALPYIVVNNHGYQNTYELGYYGLLNMSMPQIAFLFQTVNMLNTRGVIVSYNEWGPFL